MSKISHQELLATVRYDTDSGLFTWLEPKPWRKSDMTVGYVAGYGYRDAKIKGMTYKLHRLAWFYAHGVWPSGFIDHINHDRADNRISNLRIASKGANSMNSRTYKSNKLGVRGVRLLRGKFEARVQAEGKSHYLGLFLTIEEATEARVRAAKFLQGEFYPGE